MKTLQLLLVLTGLSMAVAADPQLRGLWTYADLTVEKGHRLLKSKSAMDKKKPSKKPSFDVSDEIELLRACKKMVNKPEMEAKIPDIYKRCILVDAFMNNEGEGTTIVEMESFGKKVFHDKDWFFIGGDPMQDKVDECIADGFVEIVPGTEDLDEDFIKYCCSATMKAELEGMA